MTYRMCRGLHLRGDHDVLIVVLGFPLRRRLLKVDVLVAPAHGESL